MWTEENINSAAQSYADIQCCNFRYLTKKVETSNGIKSFTKEAFLAGAKYVIDNTQKEQH